MSNCQIFYFAFTKDSFTDLLIALPDTVNLCLWQFLGEEADKDDNGEAADHSDGTAVDGVEGGIFAQQHIDDGEADTPDEACPDGGGGHAAPVESQEEGSQEGTCQSTPTDAHELGNEGGRIEGDEHGDDDEEDDEHTHDDYLAAFNLLGYLVVDFTTFHLVGSCSLVAVDEVEGHGGG